MAILQRAFSILTEWTAASRGGGKARDPYLLNARIEEAVTAYDARIRGASGYKSKLAGPVEKAFKYSREIADQLPESFECSRRTLGEESALAAMFINPGHLDEVLHRNSVLPDFFGRDGQAAECHALMCVHRTEKKFFGAAMVGDQVIEDVPQVRVNFGNHHFKVTAPSREEAHSGARDYFFRAIVGYAANEKAKIFTERVKNKAAVSKLSLKESLDLLADVLSVPESVLRMQQSPVAVSRTGVKQDKISVDQGCLNFTLPEVHIGDSFPEGLMLVSIPREEIRLSRGIRGLDLKNI